MKTDYEHEHDYEPLFPQQLQHFYATIAVAPLVVVPADYFHKTVAERESQFAVENAGMRIADDVVRNQRLLRIFEHAFVTFVAGGFFEGRVDGIRRGIFRQNS